jgi:undecaprenyl diphosphate synthase
VQDLKAEVIRLNRDLLILEEELLYPAGTQVALFVSMDVGRLFELESVQIKLDDKVISQHLYTNGIPDPDLLIRTSGELRLSNFLLWQLAYTEMVVTDVLWPDFRAPQLEAAIRAFGARERRFGKTGAQVRGEGSLA